MFIVCNIIALSMLNYQIYIYCKAIWIKEFTSSEKHYKKMEQQLFARFRIAGRLSDREATCLVSHRQGSNLESCVWMAVSSHSSHHPQEVIMAQLSLGLYVCKCGLKPHSFIHLFIPALERGDTCQNSND